MTISDLLADEAIVDALKFAPPLSPYTGRPLSLTDTSHWVGGVTEPARREGPRRMTWENCWEPEWWFGADDGIYTHQIRQEISDDELRAAALRAGYAQSEIEEAIIDRATEKSERERRYQQERHLVDAQARKRKASFEAWRREQSAAMPGWEFGYTSKAKSPSWRKNDFVICRHTRPEKPWRIDRHGQQIADGFATPSDAAAHAEQLMVS